MGMEPPHAAGPANPSGSSLTQSQKPPQGSAPRWNGAQARLARDYPLGAHYALHASLTMTKTQPRTGLGRQTP
eukprot:4116280-Prymnesium_polylepis.1